MELDYRLLYRRGIIWQFAAPEYRGEIKVVLFNTRDSEFSIQKGDRIAQAILMRHEPIEWRKLMNLPETDRGIGGLGSTGR